MKRPKHSSPLSFVVIILFATTAFAQPKPGYDPSSTHIFPAGAKRGTQVKVLVGAECIPPKTRFTLFGKGVKAPGLLTKRVVAKSEPSPRRKPTIIPITIPREWASNITIDKNAPPGVVYWRLSCAQGGTELRPFVIGELPEFIENESNSTPTSAESVNLPVTVNGRIFGERDNDYFKFTAEAGDTIVCEMLAHRLKSRLDPIVQILDIDGRPVAVERIYVKNDPVLAFKAESSGEYLLRIANVSFHGDPAHVYRVNLTRQPFVRSVFPTTGTTGTDREITFRLMTGGSKPRLVKQKIRFPKQPGLFRFTPKINGRSSANSVTLRAVNHLVISETGTGNQRSSATRVTLPTTIDGRFATKSNADWFAFDAKAELTYTLDCSIPETGSRALPTLTVFDAKGTQLQRVTVVESDDRRCRLDWRAPKTGRFLVRVRDQRYGASGGPEFVYRLTMKRAAPDFDLEVSSEVMNLTQGKKFIIPVYVRRYGGFEEPITLKFEGLPKGVTAKTQLLEGTRKRYDITVTASKSAPSQDARIRIVGLARAGLTKLVHAAKPRTLDATVPASLAGTIQLTVKHKPVFRLYCPEAYQYAYRGSVFMYPMTVERLNGFQGEVIIHEGDRQNRDMDGVEIGTLKVPPMKSDVQVPIYMPESMHINVQSQTQLYSQAYATFKDEHGKQQSVLVLSEKRNMLRTLPPVAKLNAAKTVIKVEPGTTVKIPLQLERTTNFPGPMTIRLRKANGIDGRPITFKEGESKATTVVQVAKGSRLPQTITLRGTGRLKDGTRIISETRVRIVQRK